MEGDMSSIKRFSVCCAALSMVLFASTAPAGAFSTETASGENGGGIGQSIKEGDRAPALQISAVGTSAATAVRNPLPSEAAAAGNQSGSAIPGSTFDPEETRYVFGPFNHFGYGSAIQ